MSLLWVVVVLGVIEGATEFLPVSSTGHLILAEHLLPTLPGDVERFTVVIQVGAIAAVAWLYRARFAALLHKPEPGKFGGTRGLLLLGLATAPALVVAFALRHHLHRLHAPLPVALALAVGGLALLALERLRGDRGTSTVDELSYRAALGIGLFQCLSLWPGTSRSAATIAGGMLLGLTRKAAAEFSFLAAVPILVAASGYELAKESSAPQADSALYLGVGLVVSAVAAWFAVKAFTAFLARSTMVPFAVYRLLLAAAVAALVLG